MNEGQILLSFLMGAGLAAACGLRVFMPLLVVSAAGLSGWLPLGEGFSWLGSWPALAILSTATVLEVGAFYIPWLDNFLDAAATPAAALAGTVVMASSLTELDPLLRWTLAAIAGGGAATTVHGLGASIRGASTAVTGGIANPLLATVETATSLFLSVLSVVVPVLAALFVVILLFLLWRFAGRILRLLRRGSPQTDGQDKQISGA